MIVITKETCGGEPRIDRTRITVKNVIGLLFAIDSNIEEIKNDYILTDIQIKEVENYIYNLINRDMNEFLGQ